MFNYYHGKKADWESKILNIIIAKFTDNYATKYGLNYEKVAKESLVNDFNTDMFETGLVVNHNIPFLAFSPDGFIVQNDQTILIEIKCPFLVIEHTF